MIGGRSPSRISEFRTQTTRLPVLTAHRQRQDAEREVTGDA